MILTWLFSPLGRLVAGGAGILVFIAAFAFDQQNRGASKVVAKIERQTNEAVSQANRARSGSATARGVLDPHTIVENISP